MRKAALATRGCRRLARLRLDGRVRRRRGRRRASSAKVVKIGGTFPLSGTAASYAPIARGHERVLQLRELDEAGSGQARVAAAAARSSSSSTTTATTSRTPSRRRSSSSSRTRCSQRSADSAPSRSRPFGTYLNKNKVPQLYVSTGATFWGAQQKDYKWTLGWQPDYQGEGAIYGRRIKANTPNAKIGDPLPERRLRQGLHRRSRGGSRREQEPDRGHARLQPHRRVRCAPAARAARIGCGHVDDLRHADAHDPHVRDAAGDQLEAGQRST